MADPAEHDQVGQLRLPAVLPRQDVVDFAPRGRASAPGAAAVAGGDRAAQALGDGAGGPPDVQRLTGPAQHDRHHRRVTGEHPQRRRTERAAEIQAGGAGPLLQIGEPDQDVQLRSPPTAGGQGGGVGVVEHPAARVGQRLGLALSGGAVVLGGARRGLGVDEGGDRVEHRRVVEPAHQPAPTAAAVALQVQLVDAWLGVFVGLRPSASSASNSCSPRPCSSVGAQSGIQAASCASAPIHRCGSSRRRVRPEHPGDDLDMPNARRTRVEPAAVAGNRGGNGVPSSPTRGRTCSAALRCRRASTRSHPSRSANAAALER